MLRSRSAIAAEESRPLDALGKDRRQRRRRSLDAAGDPERTGRVVTGLHTALRFHSPRLAEHNCYPRPPQIVGVRRRPPELAALLGMIAARLEQARRQSQVRPNFDRRLTMLDGPRPRAWSDRTAASFA